MRTYLSVYFCFGAHLLDTLLKWKVVSWCLASRYHMNGLFQVPYILYCRCGFGTRRWMTERQAMVESTLHDHGRTEKARDYYWSTFHRKFPDGFLVRRGQLISVYTGAWAISGNQEESRLSHHDSMSSWESREGRDQKKVKTWVHPATSCHSPFLRTVWASSLLFFFLSHPSALFLTVICREKKGLAWVTPEFQFPCSLLLWITCQDNVTFPNQFVTKSRD